MATSIVSPILSQMVEGTIDTIMGGTTGGGSGGGGAARQASLPFASVNTSSTSRQSGLFGMYVNG